MSEFPKVREGFSLIKPGDPEWNQVPEPHWLIGDGMMWEMVREGHTKKVSEFKGVWFARPVRIPSEIKVPEGYELVPAGAYSDIPYQDGQFKVWNKLCGWTELKMSSLPAGTPFNLQDVFLFMDSAVLFARPVYNRIPDVIKCKNCGEDLLPGQIECSRTKEPVPPKGEVIVPREEWAWWYPPDRLFKYWDHERQGWFELLNYVGKRPPMSLKEQSEKLTIYPEKIHFCRPIADWANYYRPGPANQKVSQAETVRSAMASLMDHSTDTCGKITAVEPVKDFNAAELGKLFGQSLQVKPACKDCRFSHVVQEESEFNSFVVECRRYAPMRVEKLGITVYKDYWCGEFQPKTSTVG